MTPDEIQDMKTDYLCGKGHTLESIYEDAYRLLMEVERLQKLLDGASTAYVRLLAERDAYRRGQGPAPTPATPGHEALHETHPIPNSRGDDQ